MHDAAAGLDQLQSAFHFSLATTVSVMNCRSFLANHASVSSLKYNGEAMSQ